MKTKIFLSLALMLTFGFVSAQFSQHTQSGLLSDNYSIYSQKPVFGLQLGSSFSTGFGGGFFSHSVSPHLTFHPGRNFSFMVGSQLSTGSLSGSSSPIFGSTNQGRLHSATVYALGAYRMNPRLVVSGGVWTERNNMPAFFTPQINPQAFNRTIGGMMVGFDYKINKKFSIGAQMNVSHGSNPFMPMQTNPFNSNPMYRNNQGW